MYHIRVYNHKEVLGNSTTSPNHIGGVIVAVLALSAVDCGFEPLSSETKN